jgi:hypothetical protein
MLFPELPRIPSSRILDVPPHPPHIGLRRPRTPTPHQETLFERLKDRPRCVERFTARRLNSTHTQRSSNSHATPPAAAFGSQFIQRPRRTTPPRVRAQNAPPRPATPKTPMPPFPLTNHSLHAAFPPTPQPSPPRIRTPGRTKSRTPPNAHHPTRPRRRRLSRTLDSIFQGTYT